MLAVPPLPSSIPIRIVAGRPRAVALGWPCAGVRVIDEIDHIALMGRMRGRIADERMLKLIISA